MIPTVRDISRVSHGVTLGAPDALDEIDWKVVLPLSG